jgi:hypothetical protein
MVESQELQPSTASICPAVPDIGRLAGFLERFHTGRPFYFVACQSHLSMKDNLRQTGPACYASRSLLRGV